jgi:hypothetical protein
MMYFSRGRQLMRRAFLGGVAGIVAGMLPAAALGQAAPSNSGGNSSGNSSTGTIGPAQLRDFSLGRKPAAQSPPSTDVPPDLITPRAVPGRPRTTPREASPATNTAPARTTAPPPPAPATVATPPATRPVAVAPPQPVANQPASGGGVTVALPPANPLGTSPTPADENGVAGIAGQPIGATGSLAADGEGSERFLPWLIALLLAGGAVVAWLLRARWRREPAYDGAASFVPERPEPVSYALPPEPEPEPEPERQRAPTAAPLLRAPVSGGITVKRPDGFAPVAPPPPPPVSATAPSLQTPSLQTMGIVSTRLRPWLEIELVPSRAIVDEAQASVEFDVVVTNSGNGPARQVLVEACMINAGEEQDDELKRFFDAPVGAGDRIDAIAPLSTITLKSAVSLPLAQVRAYEVGGRRLFVPVVAFNALYEWGAGKGQTSASFLLGRATGVSDEVPGDEGEAPTIDRRMAPLRLDLGPRLFRRLDARRHSMGKRR